MNFAWWVNKVDRAGNNVFEGGFLGLDNITVIDRSEPLPAGAVLEQSDTTGWMGMFCLNLMRIALELAKANRAYEALATKFFQHYIYVGAAMKGRLRRVLDPEEFLSPWGLRSLSRHHLAHPFRLGDRQVGYEPAEARERIKGGNSNWRGPVWFPTSFLMIESLRKLGTAFGPSFQVPADGQGGPMRNLWEVAEDMANRMIRIFTRDASGRRPVYGDMRKFQEDPHWRDLILF